MANEREDDPHWMPDWLLDRRNPPARDIVLSDLPPVEPNTQQAPPDETAAGGGENENEERPRIVNNRIVMRMEPERTVSRTLRGIQLFMITLNGTLGTGLYWRGGQMLQLGGPLAVFFSFTLVGGLAWTVMQCIAELLCIWPIPGALSVYVDMFIDAELGIAVGVAYWFTYSVSFAALMVTVASELEYWLSDSYTRIVKGTLVYLAIPFCLVLVNGIKVEIFGWIEVVSGSIKLVFLSLIMIFLLVIRGTDQSAGSSWNTPTEYNRDAAPNGLTAFFMSMSIATFSYVGVEIIAASALEARQSSPRRHEQGRSTTRFISTTVKFTAIYFPFLAAVAYTLSSLFASFDIRYDDPRLPNLSWLKSRDDTTSKTTSVFVIIAKASNIPSLGGVFNAFLVFTALTCANTNLFVAARTLFGLTAGLNRDSGSWHLRFLAFFGETNRRQVPIRAVIFSALTFCWVPFLELITNSGEADTPSSRFIEVLAQMGSVGVVIVWACNCWAYIRFYSCIKRHRAILQEKKILHVRRWDRDEDDYLYRSHWQPILAWIALLGCLFILVVVDGSLLWNGFYLEPFLSAYLCVLVFILLWAGLKLSRGASWSLVDLSKAKTVIEIIESLNDKRLEATHNPPSN